MARRAKKGKAGDNSPAFSPTKQLCEELIVALQNIKADPSYPNSLFIKKIDTLLGTDDPRKIPYSEKALIRLYKEIMRVSASYREASRFHNSYEVVAGIERIPTSSIVMEEDYV